MAETVRFQHYEVLRREDGSLFELGRGAMGITYKAFDTSLRCDVALKVINSAYLNSEVARQRFLREARAAAALRHQNVATVFHLGSEDDNFFYAMEFVDGETVEAYMKREGAVPPVMALEIAIQVARALAAAEKQGLVHRDIKPSNLMLARESDQDFLVKVIDFGLAKSSNKEDGEDVVTLTSGGFLGTPHFASPEQLDERHIDVRSDIYSLGVTLWYMLAGKTPFSGSLAQVMSQHLHREPPFESLEGQAPEIVALLKRMMAKAAEDRPQTPALLRRELDACLVALRSRPLSDLPRPLLAPSDPFETAELPSALAEAPATLASGHVLAGRFQLIEEVIASDYGRMFRATSLEDSQAVAVLILHAEKLTTAQSFTQLEDEVERIQRLRSPSIRRILSLERTDHESFIVLEWVDGPSLLDLLRARRALSLPETNLLLAPLADAFDELSAAGLSCPDIAAHEVVLVGGDAAKPVAEWPALVAKFLALTQVGSASLPADATMVASSFAMMKASGAFAGNPSSAFTFAVASLAFEMLGGVRGGTGTYAPIPGLSAEANAILRRGRLDPSKGFPTARDFVVALSRTKVLAPSSPPPRATPPPVPVPAPHEEPSRKPVWPLIAVSVAVFLLIVVAGIFLGGRPDEDATPKPAAGDSPSPAVGQSTPAPTAPPDPYQEELAAADSLLHQDDFAAALLAYSTLARKFPDEKVPLEKLEMVSAGIRQRSTKMSPAEKAAFRPALEAAAALHVVSAQMILGESLKTTNPGEALKWFLAAADQGQTEAMVYAGQLLAKPRGAAPPDLPAAVAWFTRAADLGDSAGMYCLAECYLFAKGVDKDARRAVELLTAASALNDARSMNLLGTVYRQGVDGLFSPNYAEAERLFTKAAELGFLDAQGNLGVLYINGQGVPRDATKAVSLFQSGAEKGNAVCMYFYALCLESGVGVEKNPDEARNWYVLAAQGGNKLAIDWCVSRKVPFTNSP